VSEHNVPEHDVPEHDREILGIDIGGSGIKAALVDVVRGEFKTERLRIDTPQPATPEAVAAVVAKMAREFAWQGPIGCTFPAIVKNGVTLSAANVDKGWIGLNARALFERVTGRPVLVMNDADAAGLAEMTCGAGRDKRGVVFVLTFGTGIGSAVFLDGRLLPNTELGHLELAGREVEPTTSNAARKREDLSWKHWAARVDRYLKHLDFLFSPDLFILGGGVSKRHDKFLPLLSVKAPVVPAQLQNDAGIIGVALAARGQAPHTPQQT
jgi:polyphosphate glucokinase